MLRTLTALSLTLVILLGAAAPAVADTPRNLWIKMKCALCHGEDGASTTPAGKQTKSPDLRTAEFQKLGDGEIAKLVTDGHAKMPSFKSTLNQQQVNLLVNYLRSIKAPTPKK